jgi:hypothetical protein
MLAMMKSMITDTMITSVRVKLSIDGTVSSIKKLHYTPLVTIENFNQQQRYDDQPPEVQFLACAFLLRQ